MQQRGAAIIKARGASSAASAASAAIDHVHDWALGTAGDDWVSMAVASDGSYGITEGIVYSYPVRCVRGEYQIVQGLAIDEFGRGKHGRDRRRSCAKSATGVDRPPLSARARVRSAPTIASGHRSSDGNRSIWLVLLLGGTAHARLPAHRPAHVDRSCSARCSLAYYVRSATAAFLWKLLLLVLFAGCSCCSTSRACARDLLTRRVFGVVPHACCRRMSQTEQEALEAGTVWWDGELFTGMPDWRQAAATCRRRSSRAEEQAFLDGPCEELCRMLDDWRSRTSCATCRRTCGNSSRTQRFFAMIIPKEYGGLGFSALAHSMVLAKLSSRSVTASSHDRRAELARARRAAAALRHRRAEAPLPAAARARRGDPCFALTGAARRLRCRVASPTPASSARACTRAASRRHSAELGQALHHARAGRDGARPRVQALRSGPPARRRSTDIGITCALIPTRHCPASTIGRRHFPLNIPFQNGPTGQGRVRAARLRSSAASKMAGQGWRMLVRAARRSAAASRCRRTRLGGAKAACTPPARTRACAGSSTCRSASSRASRKRSRAWPATST